MAMSCPPAIMARSAIHTSRTNRWCGFPAWTASTTISSTGGNPNALVPAHSSGCRRAHSLSESSPVARSDAVLEPVVDFEQVGRDLAMAQDGVVVAFATGARHLPPGAAQGVEGMLVIGPRQQQVDVVHRSQAGLGVARRHGRALEDHRLEADVGEGTHGERDGAGQQEDRLHPEGVGHVAQGGSVGAESIQGARRVEHPPQQRADPLVRGGTHRPGRVGPSGERPPDAGRVRIPAAGLPQQRGRLLGHASRLAAHVLIMPSRNRWPRPRPMRLMTVAEGWVGTSMPSSRVSRRCRWAPNPSPGSLSPGGSGFRGKVKALT